MVALPIEKQEIDKKASLNLTIKLEKVFDSYQTLFLCLHYLKKW